MPTAEEQQDIIAKAEGDSFSAFAISQEEIDAVLARGDGVQHGKFRIYERYLENQSATENAKFLRDEYGTGGRYPAYPSAELNVWYDSEGVKFNRGSTANDNNTILLSWNKVAKRIGELIAADRYLSGAEKKEYQERLKSSERRAEISEKSGVEPERPDENSLSSIQPKKEYRFSLGDTVYLGTQEYELLAFDEQEVRLYDVEFPLFNKTMPREEFDRKLSENPQNDHLLVDVEKQPEAAPEAEATERAVKQYDLGYGAAGNGLTVWNRLEMVHGDYKPVAHIHSDRSIVFYDANMPESIKAQIREVANKSELTISATQDEPVFSAPPREHDEPQAETALDRAQRLIREFCADEYGDEADLSDLSSIPIAYTTTEDDKHEIQITADLTRYRLLYEVDGDIVHTLKCDSLDELNEYLANLDFGEMTSDAEVHYKEAQQEQSTAPAPIDRGDEMLQQAMLAAGISEQTGQNVFGFEAGSLQPVNAPASAPVEKQEAPVLTPPAPKPRSKVSSVVLHPDVPTAQRHEYRITDNKIGVGTPSERYTHNVAAISTLKSVEAEDRLATPDEQEILAQYVGWGGLADCFDERNSHYAELKALLTDEEYAAARESTLTAFYTPPTVINSMYQALRNLGFKTGNILEPSCGVGNFIGMKPDTFGSSKIYGVELDDISGRIARQLYQNSSVAIQGFESTNLPDSFFDVAIGNVPYGNFKVSDKRYDKLNFLIHDYFFAKTLDKVRPGGVIAFVTSKGTMDKENPAIRKYIAQRADLLGAIRLPNDAFKGAAGTEVTSDILFLQKRDTLTEIEPEWVHLNISADGHRVNQYFVDHPEMVLGELKEVSGPYGAELACLPIEGARLDELLADAINNIEGHITEYELDDPQAGEDAESIPADPDVRNFSYTIVDGKVYYRENSVMTPAKMSATAEKRVRGLIGIRDSVRALIEYQTEDYPDEYIESEQRKLNSLYDDFVKKYGLINSRANNSAFGTDSSFFLLSSLEVLDDEGNFERKADMFYKRTIKKHVVVTSVDTSSEALTLSLGERGRVDMDYMMSLTGKSEEDVFDDLRGVIFLNPQYDAESGGSTKYLAADEYLSGNVREKLAQAKRSAEHDPAFTLNVEALERVQPADLTASEISVRLGATWLPESDVEAFMFDLFDTGYWPSRNMHVHFCRYTGEWNIEGKSFDRVNIKANKTYGTSRINGYKIIEETLNLRDVRIFDYIEDEYGRKKPVLNKKETAIAQGKQAIIKQAFQDWIWSDPARRERLCKIYNEIFNSIRPREYDGSCLTFPGINPEITLRPHQVNAIAHVLYGGNTLLAHVVGAGKTFEMVAAAMEAKRLGMCQKSLFVVPNHLTEQWASEFLQLYPSANILVATKKDFETKNRKRFCGKIATGDYDAIIMGHSQFEKIPMSIDRQRFFLEQQLDEIVDGIRELKEQSGDRFSVKQLEQVKKSTEAKLEKLNDQGTKDDVVTFEELGVDRLFVDEAHYYKNLAAFSKMRNVGGISQTEAKKSSDLYMKCRYLDELTGARGVVFATGTPISNTMVELYTMQRYLQYNTLKQNNLTNFDAWASTFGETVTAIELAPEGTGYRAKTRFAKFYNLPELMAMFKEVADIQTADMLNLPVPKAIYHTEALKPSEIQKEMVSALADRAERVRGGGVNSSEDNMLLITNDGRKLALDQRLMNELLPDSETSKVGECAKHIYEIWQQTAEQRSAQMAFCDLSTPHGDGKFNVYDDLKAKLINLGIPAEEIAFIHDAATEAKKKELFAKVRSGQVRVLLGSTQKMGAGTNAQTRLKALHHLDCPWRPSDLQQREGRIIRQGNQNAEVDIYTYVTENTFDSYLYQLVEGKQKFISQIMTSKSPVRSAEDVDETALSYAEIKALCTGNPYIKEKMDLDIEVARLNLLRSSHLSQKYSLQDAILKELPERIQRITQQIDGYHADAERVNEQTALNKDGFSPMTIEGRIYTEKKAAGSALLEVCQTVKLEDVPIGEYRGFAMSLCFDSFRKCHRLTLKGALSHPVWLGTDIFGNIQRLDNELEGFGEWQEKYKAELEDAYKQLETAKVEVDKPFPQEQELKEKTARLNELNAMLNLDKRESEIVDESDEVNQDQRPPTDELAEAAAEMVEHGAGLASAASESMEL